MSDKDLVGKIRDGIQNGKLSLTSSDIQQHAAAAAEDENRSLVNETSTATTPDMADIDKVTAQGDGHDAAKLLESKGSVEDPLQVADATSLSVVTVSPSEKQAYIQSVITGEAFRIPFSLCGGSLNGVIRSRSNNETYAILTQLEREIREKKIQSAVQYNTRLRLMVLSAQVETFNGVEFARLQTPYLATIGADGAVKEPAWLAGTEYWSGQQDHVLAMLYNEVTTFERKYWVLIEGAKTVNFWKPEAST